jgi:biotin carboxyl carrier protein
MKKFKVTVDGQAYTVTVEELDEKVPPPVSKPAKTAATTVSPAPVEQETPQNPSSKPVSTGEKSAPAAGFSITAPMPGSIIDVKVREGEAVKEGDVLLILEAMKMENEVTAPRAGSVTAVLVQKGDTVNSGDPLLTIG